MLRATLKGLLHRKLRLALAVIAVVLGVGFVSGANVLTDSLSAGFDRLFQTVNQNVAVQVQLDADTSDGAAAQGAEDAGPARLSDADLERIRAVDGVADVTGEVSSEGVIPFHAGTGKAVKTGGAPSLGSGLHPGQLRDPDSVLRVARGEAPRRSDEVALTRHTADLAGVGVGDTLKVYVPHPHEAREYQVTGVLTYTGDRASLGGETLVGFTIPEGQRLFYGEEGVFSGAAVRAEAGASDSALKKRVAGVLPTGFTAKTGEEVADEQASQIQQGLGFVNWFFLTFAMVALLVGVFLIFNTFNIVVAQRSRELAMCRALGASRLQVTGAVLVEALLVGAIGSALGLLLGIGLAIAAVAGFGLFGVELPDGGVVVAASTVLVAFSTGVGVTAVSALAPAIRASGVPPVAAMRDVARPDKPLRALVICGLLLALPGAVAIGLALSGMGDATLPALGLGVVGVFIGVALLSPLLTWPLAGSIGSLLSWGAASKLGRRNALRNPRRTAVTAAALMIGVTLVSAVSMLGASFKATAAELLNDQRGADVMISTNSMSTPPSGQTGFDPEKLEDVRKIEGVRKAVALHAAASPIEGRQGFIGAVDISEAQDLLALEAKRGEVRDLADNEALITANAAEDRDWRVGDRITAQLPTGPKRSYTIIGTYSSPLMSGLLLPESAAEHFGGPLAYYGFVKLEKGTDSERVADRVEKIMADFPLVTVADRGEMVEQVTGQIDIALNIFAVLLLLAIVIAFLGIVNTLLLSIYERTRELGMLRAIGMARRQVKRMIRVESVIMTVFGCVLGIGLGLALGMAVASALVDQGQLTAVALPGADLAGFVIIAVVAGVLAGWWPAFRASRLNVLDAIAYE